MLFLPLLTWKSLSQSQHHYILGWIILCCGGWIILCVCGNTPARAIHWIPEASPPPRHDNENMFSNMAKRSLWENNCPWLRTTYLILFPLSSNASKFCNFFPSSKYLCISKLQLLNNSRDHLETIIEFMSEKGP